VGAILIGRALAVEPDKITPRARLVLVAMAVHAHDYGTDKTPACTYYGGHGLLAATLGRYPTATALRGIRRDLTTLVAVGVIETLAGPKPGSNAVYRLRLPGVDKRRKSVDKPP
jgi:hypothetical protein